MLPQRLTRYPSALSDNIFRFIIFHSIKILQTLYSLRRLSAIVLLSPFALAFHPSGLPFYPF